MSFAKFLRINFLTEHLWTIACLRGQKKLLRFQCSRSLGNVLFIQKGKIKESKLSIHNVLFTFKGFFFLASYLCSAFFKSGKFFLHQLQKDQQIVLRVSRVGRYYGWTDECYKWTDEYYEWKKQVLRVEKLVLRVNKRVLWVDKRLLRVLRLVKVVIWETRLVLQ